MKVSIILSTLMSLVAASPTPTLNEVESAHLVKRASVSEKATLGYASTNGGYVILFKTLFVLALTGTAQLVVLEELSQQFPPYLSSLQQ